VISLMEKTLQVLNNLVLDGVLSRYAIGGAMGATFYAEPVLTFDLDIFVILPQTVSGLLTLEPLYEALRARGYTEEGECVNIEGIPVQFLPAYNDLLVEALTEAREVFYEQTPTRVRAQNIWWPSPFRPDATRTVNACGCCVTKRDSTGITSQTCSPGTVWKGNRGMDKLDPEIARLINAKEQRRNKLATLPFAEKVRLVVKLQQMAAPVLRARGRLVRAWILDDLKRVPRESIAVDETE
jgi:hypothetical protein